MISYMKTEFGDAADRAVVYDGKKSSTWFLDQKIITILIYAWIKQHGPDRVKLLYRDNSKDRSAFNNNKYDKCKIKKLPFYCTRRF